jgi:hypothetical protein
MLLEEEVAYVVADAAEGYNPTHDVCRLVIDAATARASRVRGRLLTSFDFPLVGRPDACPQELRGEAVAIQLGDAELARKLTAARGYDGLEAEVSEAVNGLGTEVFRRECLRPVRQSPWLNEPASPPFYERHGQDRVRAGHYRRVVRYRDHIRPLVESLRREQERSL